MEKSRAKGVYRAKSGCLLAGLGILHKGKLGLFLTIRRNWQLGPSIILVVNVLPSVLRRGRHKI